MTTPFSVQNPPSGMWYECSPSDTVIGISHRHPRLALMVLALALFWNLEVLPFGFEGLVSTLKLMNLPYPQSFLGPVMTGTGVNWGITLLSWAFMASLIGIGLSIVAGVFFMLWGVTVLSMNEAGGYIFTGVGKVGRTKRFYPHEIRNVRVETETWTNDEVLHSRHELVLIQKNGKRVKFDYALPAEELDFLASALRHALKIKEG